MTTRGQIGPGWSWRFERFLAALALVLSCFLTASCRGGFGADDAPTQLSAMRRSAQDSDDPELVGRWLLTELISPGGDHRAARNARRRLDKLGGGGLLAHLGRALDDDVHGRLHTAPEHYLNALKAARGSSDQLAPFVGWFSANRAVGLRYNAPELWPKWKHFVQATLREPGNIGWRARGELVEWAISEAYSGAERGVRDKASREFGCVEKVRLAGPFGHGSASDSFEHFAAEEPGPWPRRFAAGEANRTTPRILQSERQGCFVQVDERVAGGIFYAESYLDLDVPQELLIAVQGALAVWVDDQLVLDRDPRKWGVWPKFGVQVWLPAGRHRLLARLAEPRTSVRIMAPDGRPIAIKSSAAESAPYSILPPRISGEPNVLSRFVDKGDVIDPKDDILRFVASSLAFIEGQGDLASVLAEPLLEEPARATGTVLLASANYAGADPLFDRSQLRDLTRELQERAAKRDPDLWEAQLALALWRAESKGPTESIRQVQKLVDRFPRVPAVLIALARMYGELGWSAELAESAKKLAERFPHDAEALSLAVTVYDTEGQNAKADALVQRIRKLDPDSDIALSRALAREDYAAAIAELKRLAARRPDNKEIAERIFDVMVRAGNASETWKKLEAAIEKSPKSGAARLALADAHYASGKHGALRKALVDGLTAGANTAEIEDALDLVEGVSQLSPYRIDGRDIIAKYEKADKHLPGTAARVLDYAAVWVHSDGSSRMLEHEVIRIQSPEAIDKMAEHPKLDGLVLHMRVIKKDGRMLEPEPVPGKPTVTFPHLEVGDYIETEHVISRPSESLGGKSYVSPHWFFREENVAYARSEFVVITPAHKQPVVETHGNVPPPEVKQLDGLTLRRWRVDESPAAPQEPGSPPLTEFLPSVRMGWGVTLSDRVRALADTLDDVTPVDPRIVRIAKKIVQPTPKSSVERRAQKLYRWVLANVNEGQETDGRRVVVGKQGNRWRGFTTLCRALGIQVHYAVARNRLAAPAAGPLEQAQQFTEPLLRLTTPKGHIWLTVGSKFAPFGYVPVEVRGVPAYVLSDPPTRVTTPARGTEDSVVYTGSAKLTASGNARIQLNQEFHGKYAMAVRSAIWQLSETELAELVETRLVGRALRGARLNKFSFRDRDDLDKPLVLEASADVPAFAHKSGAELALPPPFSPRISQLASLPTRQTPLLIGESTHQEVRLSIELPKGASASGLNPHTVKHEDMLVAVKDREQDGTLILDRVIDLPAGRVQPKEYAQFVQFARRADDALSGAVRIRVP